MNFNERRARISIIKKTLRLPFFQSNVRRICRERTSPSFDLTNTRPPATGQINTYVVRFSTGGRLGAYTCYFRGLVVSGTKFANFAKFWRVRFSTKPNSNICKSMFVLRAAKWPAKRKLLPQIAARFFDLYIICVLLLNGSVPIFSHNVFEFDSNFC